MYIFGTKIGEANGWLGVIFSEWNFKNCFCVEKYLLRCAFLSTSTWILVGVDSLIKFAFHSGVHSTTVVGYGKKY